MNEFGLTERQISLLKATFLECQIEPTDVKVFGSRALGTYQPHSDIDLVIFGSINTRQIAKLWTLFEESSIPNKVDLCAYCLIKTPALKKHIDTFGKSLFG